MRQADPAAIDGTEENQEAESILGQFYCAFAQGAGTMRIRRDAIVALRARYLGPIHAQTTAWRGLASSVLPLLAQVGRLAALMATQEGQTAIAESAFTRARRIVEAGAHGSSGLLIAGPMCPPVAGETDGSRPVDGPVDSTTVPIFLSHEPAAAVTSARPH
jgi:hypothetical protein